MENSITLIIFSGLILGTLSAPNEPDLTVQSDLCPPFWHLFGDHCYKYVSSPKSWIDAELQCLSEGANLVSIHNQEEESFVKILIRNVDTREGITWIGLTDAQREGAWLWSDGSKVDFTLWNKGEPNNSGGNEKCAHTNWSETKNWNDKDCSESYAFVCSARLACGAVLAK